jgi:hypothetical protein
MKRIFVLLIFAALSQAATVSSITCNAQVATVNATAHGLIASQGFSLSGTAGTYNSTVGTAGGAVTANTFTFTLPTGTACSGFTSGYTTVVPVKQIIDISSSANPANATVTLNYLYWFTTTYPNPLPCTLPVTSGGVTTNTGCPSSVWPGASAAENAAIVAGTTIETYGQLTVPAATAAGPDTTPGTVQYIVEHQYNSMQTGFANFLLAGGFWWNGTAWANH